MAKGPAEVALDACYNQRFAYDAKSGSIMGWDGRVVTIIDASKEVGAKIGFGPRTGAAHQQWDYTDGFFITRMGTGLVIDVWGGADAVKDGGELKTYTKKGGKNQQWDMDLNGFIRSKVNAKIVMEVVGGKASVNTDEMRIQTAKATPEQIADVAKLKKAWNQRFQYDAKSGLVWGWDGRVLTVWDGNKDIGARVGYGPKNGNGGTNQQWDYNAADGFLKTRMGTGLVIDVWGGPDNVKEGGELKMYTQKGGKNQQWDLDSNGFLRSRQNNKFVMDVQGGKSNAGTDEVKLWTANA